MTYEEINNLTGAIESIATAVSLLIGGLWVYQKYIRQQEGYPNIEFLADIKYIY